MVCETVRVKACVASRLAIALRGVERGNEYDTA